jgi:hypothetical protein
VIGFAISQHLGLIEPENKLFCNGKLQPNTRHMLGDGFVLPNQLTQTAALLIPLTGYYKTGQIRFHPKTPVQTVRTSYLWLPGF